MSSKEEKTIGAHGALVNTDFILYDRDNELDHVHPNLVSDNFAEVDPEMNTTISVPGESGHYSLNSEGKIVRISDTTSCAEIERVSSAGETKGVYPFRSEVLDVSQANDFGLRAQDNPQGVHLEYVSNENASCHVLSGMRSTQDIRDNNSIADHVLVQAEAGSFAGLLSDSQSSLRAEIADLKQIREVFIRSDYKCRMLYDDTPLMVQWLNNNGEIVKIDRLRDSFGDVWGTSNVEPKITDLTGIHESENTSISQPLSDSMRSTLERAYISARTNRTVLLTGETGSGKDYLARFIHSQSPRSSCQYYTINCAAITGELAESELFGHESGAYTGALGRKRGMLELAEGGTILLNEIGELSLTIQSKLLTFLDTFSFTRVGGEKRVFVNTRIIAATNRDLWTDVSEGHFRKDLFYRLNVLSINVPSLRERSEDIPMLANQIISDFCKEMQMTTIPRLNPDVMSALSTHDWPGNVRELKNVIERALILSQGKTICKKHLGLCGTMSKEETAIANNLEVGNFQAIVEETERKLIHDALKQAEGKKQVAAIILGISRFALARHMSRLGIHAPTSAP